MTIERTDDPSISVSILMIIGFSVIILGMVRGGSSIDGYYALVKSRDILHSTVQSLSEENRVLESEITKLRESPHYARKVLRDKYHVTEEGEGIIFFLE
jgi:cell division protein FtsB